MYNYITEINVPIMNAHFGIKCLFGDARDQSHALNHCGSETVFHALNRPLLKTINRLCDLMGVCSPLVQEISDSNSSRVKPKALKLVFSDSRLSMSH